MKHNTLAIDKKRVAGTALLDIFAIAFIYFLPALSHLLSFPLYLLDPMRIVLIIALVHSGKNNAYVLAATLPLFSFMVSGHPILPKMFLIGGELALNVWLFFFLRSRLEKLTRGNLFLPAALSILLSKAVYYLAKFSLIGFAVIDSDLISTPLWLQAVTLVTLSLYLSIFMKRE